MNKYKLGVLLCLLSIGMVSYAGTLKKTFTFDRANLSFSQSDGFDVVKIKSGKSINNKAGNPDIPSVMVQLSVPSNARLENVTINATEYEYISGQYNIYPAQLPQAISDMSEKTKAIFTAQNANIYTSSTEYPEKIVESGEKNMGGYKIVYLNIHPLKYIPSEKRLKFYSKIDLNINYSEEKSVIRKTELGKEVFRKMVKEIVSNPEDVINNEVNFLPVLADTAEYLIITGDALTTEFQRLADWKTSKGMTAQIKTVSWILSNYTTGRDNQEKIWNFLKDYFANHGTVYVALCGDTNVVPVRRCWWRIPMITDDKGINCELYFSDLDGPWNSNNDANWGDPWYDSTPDMAPDVIVGRLPAGDATEAHTILDKIYAYMTTVSSDTYLLNMTGKVSIDPSSMFNPRMDAIAAQIPTKYHFTKFYESAGNGGKTKAITQLNTGPHFVCWAAHGDSVSLHTNGATTDPMKTADALGLTNGNRLFILNTLACRVVRITQNDCVAEGFILAPNGGAVAFIGNGCTGLNPQSDEYMSDMAVAIFKDVENPIGYAFSTAKAANVASASSDDYDRHLEYGLNLLGEPDMVVHNSLTGIEERPDFIGQMAKVYPNPVRGDAKFRLLGVAKGVKISLQVYDVSGKLVKSLPIVTDNSPVTTVIWDRRDNNGKKLKTGVYFYKVKNNSYEQKGKFVLL